MKDLTEDELVKGMQGPVLDPLSVTCRICNAKPGERCASVIDASTYRDVPHFSRLNAAKEAATK